MNNRNLLFLISLAVLASACSTDSTPTSTVTTATPTSSTARPADLPAPSTATTAAVTPNTTTSSTTTTTTTMSPFARPVWLGTRVLPLRADGFGEIRPTPQELIDRRLATPDTLPRPTTTEFVATIAPIPDDVLARSTWREGCPVTLENLSYLHFSQNGH